ncbi:dTDP-4-amino-4,6-dideoxygalactose transaminase [Salinimicrobium sp. HB62]|uniref:dTDP-4-amino-4,6-dideoxygalactose transaminase n=1 Tax=Salinimicrobium sp. HB62 TaxID=3077781 RepID=UPI002D7843BF|nr:dTDP-4-amino-4,6-dideoxygalactose transaminase [Salinimicrobium sp. HB62]
MIYFNKPHISGKELDYIQDTFQNGKLSGNGEFTQRCQRFFQEKFNFGRCFLTTSCTDALEMAALLLDIQSGDEIIMPSYTFVSTANAFALRGAKIVFADSRKDHPGIDEDKIEELITPKTKAIVPVHYAGVACDMDKIMDLSSRYGLYVVEDAAQAIDSYYTGRDGQKKALGSIGHLAVFSFHETKNIISGEGGMLVINEPEFEKRAEVLWEKGTNRSAFFKGEIDKYCWVDVGSSFLPSEIIAAFLWAQLEKLEDIQNQRKKIWNSYYKKLLEWAEKDSVQLPVIPSYATNNAHIFYLVFPNMEERIQVVKWLKTKKIHAIFHYTSLHKSLYYKDKYTGRALFQCERYERGLLRLPLYYDLNEEEISTVTRTIQNSSAS